jgi:DnaJ family protein C protein 11
VIQGRVSASSRLFPPPVTILISRRFFRDSLTEGTLGLSLDPPHVTIHVVSPTSFGLTSELCDTSDEIPDMVSRPGSVSGFGVGERYVSYGLTLTGGNTTVRTEWGVTFAELALQVKLALELGFAGLAWMLTGTWTSKTSQVSASVGLAFEGVFLRLEFVLTFFSPLVVNGSCFGSFLGDVHISLAYLEQRLSIPVFLSRDADAALALCTAIVPSTAFVLGYHFILKPRRRAQRAA